MGLTLVLDYNEERQNFNNILKKKFSGKKKLYNSNEDVSIYLDTISSLNFFIVMFLTLRFQILLDCLVKVSTISTI